MEILFSFTLSLRAMKTIGSRATGLAQDFKAITGYRFTHRPANTNRPDDDFWPEVSSRHSSENPLLTNPENSPQRVLLEVFLILAGACLAVVAVVIWGPMLS